MKDRLLGLIRHGLTFIGGLVVAKGYIDESSAMEIVGALMTLLGSAWSVSVKK